MLLKGEDYFFELSSPASLGTLVSSKKLFLFTELLFKSGNLMLCYVISVMVLTFPFLTFGRRGKDWGPFLEVGTVGM